MSTNPDENHAAVHQWLLEAELAAARLALELGYHVLRADAAEARLAAVVALVNDPDWPWSGDTVQSAIEELQRRVRSAATGDGE